MLQTVLTHLAVLMLLFPGSTLAQDQPKVFPSHSTLRGENPALFTYILKDENYSLAEVLSHEKFQRNEKPSLSLGYSQTAYWLRLTIRNDRAEDRPLVFQIDYPLLDEIIFHMPEGESYRRIVSGDLLPFPNGNSTIEPSVHRPSLKRMLKRPST